MLQQQRPAGHELRSEGPEKWRTALEPPDGGFCHVSNLQLPLPAVVLITDQKAKAVQALCKVHVLAMTGQDTDWIDSE